MLTIERALSRYTYKVLAGDGNCIDSIMNELSMEDRKEFIESAALIRALYYQNQSSKFIDVFERVNQRKEEMYDSMPRAVDFRGKGDDKAISEIENIFNEEFKNEDS